MENCCLPSGNHEQDEPKSITESNYIKKESNDSSTKLNKSKKINRRTSEKFNEMKQKLRDISVEDLQKLCEHISTLNERILNAREITYLRYELPVEMKDRLEMEAQELECLHAEMKDAKNHLEITRNHQAALGKEKQWMEGQIKKLKSDVVTEMEMIVSVYDNNMMERWEGVKQSSSVPQVENFLHDVKGKLEAMKNLQILGVNKLAELQKQEKKKGELLTKKEKKKMNREERGGGGRSTRSGSCIATNSSQAFIFDTESEDLLEEATVLDIVMNNLVYDQVLSLPAWTRLDGNLDID